MDMSAEKNKGRLRLPAVLAAAAGVLVLGSGAGAAAGLLLRSVVKLTELFWEVLLPAAVPAGAVRFAPLVVCPLGGILIGIWESRFHASPKSLLKVVDLFRETGEYHIDNLPAALIAFVLPLFFGGALGPMAGVSGFTAVLITRPVKRLRRAGLTAHPAMNRFFWILGIAAGMAGFKLVSVLLGAEGIPRYGKVSFSGNHLIALPLCLAGGFLLMMTFSLSGRLAVAIRKRIGHKSSLR